MQTSSKPTKDEAIFNLHQEKLNITKRKIQTGDVTVRKEIIHDLKNITVPVTREELVIENNKVNPANGKRYKDTIRIPYKEERVSIEKETVQLEDVSIFKKQLVDYQRVNESLKKEQINVNTSGDCSVIDK